VHFFGRGCIENDYFLPKAKIMTKSSLQNAPKHPPKEVATLKTRIKSGFSGIEKERFSFIKISVLMWQR